MSYTIQIRDGDALSMDGQYVKQYSAKGWSVSPDGYEMDCLLLVTADQQEALQFPTLPEAIHKYLESNGRRCDGRPNRPLTAFSVEFAPVGMPENGIVFGGFKV